MPYGYLLAQLSKRDVLSLADGTERVLPEGEGQHVLAARQAELYAQAREQAQAAAEEQLRGVYMRSLEAWARGFDAFRDSVQIEPVVEGILRTRSSGVSDVRFPDGTRRLDVPDSQLGAVIEAVYPFPPPPEPPSAEALLQPAPAAGACETVTCWELRVTLPGEEQADGEVVWNWDSFFPTEAVMRKLNALAAGGWRVVHVSEDRRAFSGSAGATESGVCRARYLLASDG